MSKPQFEVDVSFAPFSRSTNESDDGRILAAQVREAVEGCINLDAHPNSAITVAIKFLQAPCELEALVGPCITAASIALRDAGISMDDFVIAVSLPARKSSQLDTPINKGCATIGLSLSDKKVRYLHVKDSIPSAADLESMVGEAEMLIESICSRVGLSQ